MLLYTGWPGCPFHGLTPCGAKHTGVQKVCWPEANSSASIGLLCFTFFLHAKLPSGSSRCTQPCDDIVKRCCFGWGVSSFACNGAGRSVEVLDPIPGVHAGRPDSSVVSSIALSDRDVCSTSRSRLCFSSQFAIVAARASPLLNH